MLGEHLEIAWRFSRSRAALARRDDVPSSTGSSSIARRIELRHEGAPVPVEPQVFALCCSWSRTANGSSRGTRSSRRSGTAASSPTRRSTAGSSRRGAPSATTARRSASSARSTDRGSASSPTCGKPRRRPPPSSAHAATSPPTGRDASRRSPCCRSGSLGDAGPHATIADALPDELIAELARLRWLFVIARGSSFRFRSATPDLAEVGKALGVRYCLVRHGRARERVAHGRRAARRHARRRRRLGRSVRSSVADVHDDARRRSWRASSPRSSCRSRCTRRAPRAACHPTTSTPGPRITSASSTCSASTAATTPPPASCSRARSPPIRRSPAPMPARRSCTSRTRSSATRRTSRAEIQDARRSAERSVELDPLDPFANLTMGRSFWLEGDLDTSLGWLERAIAISPSYAQGIYARAWTHALSGRGAAGQQDADLGDGAQPARSAALRHGGDAGALPHRARRGRGGAPTGRERAARVAGRPRADRRDRDRRAFAQRRSRARRGLGGERPRARRRDSRAADFFRSFPFADPAARQRIAKALAAFGIER